MSFQWGVPVNRVTSAEYLRRLEVLLREGWEVSGPDRSVLIARSDGARRVGTLHGNITEAINAAWAMREIDDE